MAAQTNVFADHLKYAFGKFVDEIVAQSAVAGPVSKRLSAPVAVAEETTVEPAAAPLVTTGVALDRSETESLPIVALRALAKENGILLKKKSEILDAFEEAGFFSTSDAEADEDEAEEEEIEEDEDDDEEIEEDEDDDEEEDEEEEGLTRADLEEKTLRELRTLARGEGHTAADIKGLDQDALIDLLLEEEEEEEEEADEVEDEDEEVEIDRETLEAMTDAELKSIVSQFDIKLPRKATRKTIITTILDAAESADEDEDDDDE
jgi:hypothetical protein